MKARTFLGFNLLLAVATGSPALSHAITIDFNDAAALDALPDQARLTFAAEYTEDGMTFLPRIDPPDLALGGSQDSGHFHLNYETIERFQFVLRLSMLPESDARESAIREFAKASPRYLSPHGVNTVIQMTYDPNGDGMPDPFNLISLQVLGFTLESGEVVSTQLNVGVKGPFGIAVYNNLTSGLSVTEWRLLEPFNRSLTRATLEGTGSIFAIDNIVFEPAGRATASGQGILAATAQLDAARIEEPEAESVELAVTPPVSLAPELHEFIHLTSIRQVVVDIAPRVCPNTGTTVSRRRFFRTAILGTADLDVMEIDPETVVLEGVPPSSIDFEDVETGVANTGERCMRSERDGLVDMILQFDSQGVLDATRPLPGGFLLLELNAELFDGSPIEGADLVFIR